MKKRLFLGLISATALFSCSSHADYSFRLSNLDSCSSISGAWSGKGRASNWFIGQCDYYGSGTVSVVDENGLFTVQVNVTKDSGSPLCPPRGKELLNAVCKDGVVTIKTNFGNLNGTFSFNHADASGTLSVTPGLDADVSIQMWR